MEDKHFIPPPPSTAMGALLRYISSPRPGNDPFQPMNINFGIIEQPVLKKIRKKDRHRLMIEQARASFASWLESNGI
jgi:methylenetetrahydrofolate--tRNA-(uracil-5-)-methyltransferase